MAPKYHLVYFDIRGRAEPIRILFALAGASYTEERVHPSEWPALKTSGRCPFGQVPVLELGDGKSLCQSTVILKYVANQLGFSPSDNYAKAQAEVFVDSIKDFQNALQRLAREKAADPKDEKKSSLYDAEIANTLEFIDKLLQQNNGGKGYLVGDKISFADVCFFSVFNDYLVGGELKVPEQLKKHPLLVDLYNRVMNEPKILEYLKKRKPNPDWYSF
ncbi:S-crystallin 4 [Exaiptasia diaphana]|uniref:Glutathione S-transferase n=1 Tax=Exaiptasia diaphana TaxID=2652724 RepID=A0A913WVW1_EXADI|nr:S-crystallin 4 [Exaiptasia diaphana]KXJ05587.1 S-crystallin 4 [Exaiptasia diaphana]